MEDAEKTISINPSWAKGYSRKGSALFSLEKYEEAFRCYNKGKHNLQFHQLDLSLPVNNLLIICLFYVF